MENVTLENRGTVAILRLTHGVTNAISPDLLKDLFSCLDKIKKQFKGMILAGGTRFFSIGFNLPELLGLNREEMAHFMGQFDRVLFTLLTLPIPTACAIAGHAIAGGTILALGCDYRLAASGKKLLGLNEIKLGVPVPYLTDLTLRQIIGDRAATEILYHGEFIDTAKAIEIGMIDEIMPVEDLEVCAVDKITEMAALPQPAFSMMKANRVEAIRLRYEKNARSKTKEFLDCWFSRSAQKQLATAAKKF